MGFTEDMNKICKGVIQKKLDSTVRKTVIEIANRVVLRSPVGNPNLWKGEAPAGYSGGRFRANWQISFNSVAVGEIDAIDNTGGDTLSKITSEVDSNPAIGVTYLSNNLPYASRLENGWSSQAPAGMVSLTELEFPEIVRRASA